MRRASRKAEKEVPGESQPNDAAKRRASENRVTFSLLAVTSLEILVEILKVTWGYLARLYESDDYEDRE